jgi:hypothetical protein
MLVQPMKRPRYERFVTWIAWFDNPEADDTGKADDEQAIAQYASVRMLAKLFDVPVERVVGDVANTRLREGFAVGRVRRGRQRRGYKLPQRSHGELANEHGQPRQPSRR